jgi:hypothetical protein
LKTWSYNRATVSHWSDATGLESPPSWAKDGRFVEVDKGGVVVAPGMSVVYMEQDPTSWKAARRYDHEPAGYEQRWRGISQAEGLKFDPAPDAMHRRRTPPRALRN